MGRVLWPCGWLRGTASIYGVIPRCREERIFPLHTIVNSAPAKCCVRPVLAPAQAWVRAGAGRRGVGRLIGAFCVRITPAVRFCWDVLRWFASVDTFLLICFVFDHACYTFLLERFAFGSRPPCASIGRFCVRSRLSLFLCQEKRDGLREVAFLFRAGSGSPLVRSRMSCGYRALLGSLLACAFLCGDPDGGRRDAERRGTGAAA